MLIKPLLFFSSYAPLFLLLGIRFERLQLQLLCFGLAIAGVAAILVVLRVNSDATDSEHTFVSVREAGPEAASYLATYLLPFVIDSAPSSKDLVLYGVFFLVAAAVHMNTSVIQINPTLYALHIRVLSIRDSNGYNGLLLARGRVDQKIPIACVPLDSGVLVRYPLFRWRVFLP